MKVRPYEHLIEIQQLFYQMSLVIKITEATLHNSKISSSHFQHQYQLMIKNVEMDTSDVINLPQSEDKVIALASTHTLILQVHKLGYEIELVGGCKIRGEELAKMYTHTHKNKRSLKVEHKERINLKQSQFVMVCFTYKYDRLMEVAGNMRKLIDPQDQHKGIGKFFTDFTQYSTQAQFEHKNKKINFYKGPCKGKNMFSCCDQEVHQEHFNAIEPTY